MKQSELIKDRLKSVILTDKTSSLSRLNTVLKSDIADIMQNYMYICPADIEIKTDTLASGEFVFNVTFKTNCLFSFGKLLD